MSLYFHSLHLLWIWFVMRMFQRTNIWDFVARNSVLLSQNQSILLINSPGFVLLLAYTHSLSLSLTHTHKHNHSLFSPFPISPIPLKHKLATIFHTTSSRHSQDKDRDQKNDCLLRRNTQNLDRKTLPPPTRRPHVEWGWLGAFGTY